MTFDNATIDDFKKLMPLVNEFDKSLHMEKNESYNFEEEVRKNRRYVKKYLCDNTCRYLVCRRGDDLIAYAFLSIDDKEKDLAFINELFVIPSERRKGIAHQLLQASRVWCREQNCTKIQLTVNQKNEAALRLYAKAGFSIYQGDYIDMRLTIS